MWQELTSFYLHGACMFSHIQIYLYIYIYIYIEEWYVCVWKQHNKYVVVLRFLNIYWIICDQIPSLIVWVIYYTCADHKLRLFLAIFMTTTHQDCLICSVKSRIVGISRFSLKNIIKQNRFLLTYNLSSFHKLQPNFGWDYFPVPF